MMTAVANYVKIVELSEEDGVFVGQGPGVIGPCGHGADEVEVYRELCDIVAEWLEIANQDGTPLPPTTAGSGIVRRLTEPLAVTPPTSLGKEVSQP